MRSDREGASEPDDRVRIPPDPVPGRSGQRRANANLRPWPERSWDARPAAGGRVVVVVESPTRALALRRAVGPAVQVLATGGHVLDGRGNPRRGGGRVLQDLQAAARSAQRVLIATDPDREGEAIAAELLRFLAPAFPGKACRVRLGGDAPEDVARALAAPGTLDRDRLSARSLREELDRCFVAVAGRLLGGAIPCGRVQAAALALVVDRGHEEFTRSVLELWIELPDGRVRGEVEPEPRSRQEAELLAASLAGRPIDPASIRRRRFEASPPPPFDTASLLAEADRLGLGPERVLAAAVRLHRGVELADGIEPLLSYPRTDEAALDEPERPMAHGAIRPLSRSWPPERAAPFLEAAERRVYERVWRRTAATLADPALLEEVTVAIESGRHFRAIRTVAPGWFAEESPPGPGGARAIGEPPIAPGGWAEEGPAIVPALRPIGPDEERLRNVGTPRFGRSRVIERVAAGPFRPGELIASLAAKGVGRPSTWSTVARSLREAGWIRGQRGRLVATDEGRRVARVLGEALGTWSGPDRSMALAEGLLAVEERRLAPEEFRRRFIAPLRAAGGERGPRCRICGRRLVGEGTCSGFPLCRGAG